MPTANEIIIEPFDGDLADMREIAEFHLGIRQHQEATTPKRFSNIYASQVDLMDIDGYYKSGNGNFWTARDSEIARLVGIVGLHDEGEGHGVLKRMAVDPNFRRRRIGTRLVNTLLDHARETSFSVLTLETAKDEDGYPLYLAAGFIETGRVLRNRDY